MQQAERIAKKNIICSHPFLAMSELDEAEARIANRPKLQFQGCAEVRTFGSHRLPAFAPLAFAFPFGLFPLLARFLGGFGLLLGRLVGEVVSEGLVKGPIVLMDCLRKIPCKMFFPALNIANSLNIAPKR